jgi:serine/threonine protein phosphatase 1
MDRKSIINLELNMGSNALPSDIFAIGDIHGCASELRKLLDKLPLTQTSQIVFLGDYVDRGPHSREVIELIIELKKKNDVITLMGNHESMFMEFLAAPHSAAAGRFIFNGGGTTLASYSDGAGSYTIPEHHSDFLGTLQLFYETDKYFFVHGGVPEIALDKINMKKHGSYLLWAREPFLSSEFDWGKTIVHGHTPIRVADIERNRINIDTGCVFNNKLTAIRMSDRKLFSVDRSAGEEPVFLQDSESKRRGVRFKGAIPIQVFREGMAVVLETIDYNEFGFFGRDLSNDRTLRLAADEIIDIKINTGPDTLAVHRGIVVRVKKEKDGMYYAVRFLETALSKDD